MITRGAVDLSQFTPKDVMDFHNKDDVDSGQLAHHHTLGKASNQAAPGNHEHAKSHGVAFLTTDVALTGGVWTNFGSLTLVSFTDDIDHSSGLFTLNTEGLYRLSSRILFNSTAAGFRASRWFLDGIAQDYLAVDQVGASAFVSISNDMLGYFEAGSTVRLQVNPQSNMSMLGSTSGYGKSQLGIERISN